METGRLQNQDQDPPLNPAALLGLVCFAVKEEAGAFKSAVVGRPNMRVLVTGMGRRNAENSIRIALETARPSFVISSGFAGGLRPGLGTGTVLFEAKPGTVLFEKLEKAGALNARFHCSDKIAATSVEKRGLWERTGADAVEMESAHIHALCREKNIESATARVVLDTAEEDLPLDFNLLLNPDDEMDFRKLSLALLRNPGKIPALLRLNRQSRDAARKLSDVLVRVLC